MTLTDSDVNIISELLARAMEPIKTRLHAIEARLDAIEATVDTFSTRFDAIEGNIEILAINLKIIAAKGQNATCTRDEILVKVPLTDGSFPISDYPQTISNLVVSGNESLPSGQQNNWNAKKSLELIREYDPGYATDNDDTPDLSRKRRLTIAKLLGVTTMQLNFAQHI